MKRVIKENGKKIPHIDNWVGRNFPYMIIGSYKESDYKEVIYIRIDNYNCFQILGPNIQLCSFSDRDFLDKDFRLYEGEITLTN